MKWSIVLISVLVIYTFLIPDDVQARSSSSSRSSSRRSSSRKKTPKHKPVNKPTGRSDSSPARNLPYPAQPSHPLPGPVAPNYNNQPARNLPYPAQPSHPLPGPVAPNYNNQPARNLPYPAQPSHPLPYPAQPSNPLPGPGVPNYNNQPARNLPYPAQPSHPLPGPGAPNYNNQPGRNLPYPAQPSHPLPGAGAPNYNYPPGNSPNGYPVPRDTGSNSETKYQNDKKIKKDKKKAKKKKKKKTMKYKLKKNIKKALKVTGALLIVSPLLLYHGRSSRKLNKYPEYYEDYIYINSTILPGNFSVNGNAHGTQLLWMPIKDTWLNCLFVEEYSNNYLSSILKNTEELSEERYCQQRFSKDTDLNSEFHVASYFNNTNIGSNDLNNDFGLCCTHSGSKQFHLSILLLIVSQILYILV